jgi:hypothetical protein
MPKSYSEEQPRLLLFLIFAVIFGWFLVNAIRLWEQIDVQERWARVAELLLIALGAWVVVWPESFPPWRSSKGSRGPEVAGDHPEKSRAEPDAATDGGRDPGLSETNDS